MKLVAEFSMGMIKRSVTTRIKKRRHQPRFDAREINRAVERAINDSSFLDSALRVLAGIKFPAYKNSIVKRAAEVKARPEFLALFESLDGYMEFKDLYHVRKAIEANMPVKKPEFQITEKTRTKPYFRTRDTSSGSGIKERETGGRAEEERKDYPEVTPTAMSHFVCGTCGKAFQNQDDLARHKRFEGR